MSQEKQVPTHHGSRHAQEINVQNEKAEVINPAVEVTFAKIESVFGDDHVVAQRVGVWESILFEARALIAKLILELENHSLNGHPFLPAALTWAILKSKIPETSVIKAGWISTSDNQGVPHLYIETTQPASLLPALAALHTASSPRARTTLTTDLSSYPRPHLTDALILGQVLKLSKNAKSAPYPVLEFKRVAYTEEAMHKYHTDGEERMKFANFQFVAQEPEMYLRWAVSSEMRSFVYPLVAALLKSDPTKVEYIRITEEEVQRILEVQKKIKEESGRAEGGAGAGAGAGGAGGEGIEKAD